MKFIYRIIKVLFWMTLLSHVAFAGDKEIKALQKEQKSVRKTLELFNHALPEVSRIQNAANISINRFSASELTQIRNILAPAGSNSADYSTFVEAYFRLRDFDITSQIFAAQDIYAVERTATSEEVSRASERVWKVFPDFLHIVQQKLSNADELYYATLDNALKMETKSTWLFLERAFNMTDDYFASSRGPLGGLDYRPSELYRNMKKFLDKDVAMDPQVKGAVEKILQHQASGNALNPLRRSIPTAKQNTKNCLTVGLGAGAGAAGFWYAIDKAENGAGAGRAIEGGFALGAFALYSVTCLGVTTMMNAEERVIQEEYSKTLKVLIGDLKQASAEDFSTKMSSILKSEVGMGSKLSRCDLNLLKP